jgi:hypothetical protein
MTKRLLSLVLVVIMALGITSVASAVTRQECECEGVFVDSGTATFILDNSSRICGVLRPDEDLGTIGYQHGSRRSPNGLEDGNAIRRRKFARIDLNESDEVIRGGTDLRATLYLYNVELVEAVLGDEATLQSVVNASIYVRCPTACGKTYGSHMFLPRNSGRVWVGYIEFCSGAKLDVYVGYFFGNCSEPVIGFRAQPVNQTQEDTNTCGQCYEPVCNPCDGTEVTTTVEVTTTTTTTVTTTTVVDQVDGCCGC